MKDLKLYTKKDDDLEGLISTLKDLVMTSGYNLVWKK